MSGKIVVNFQRKYEENGKWSEQNTSPYISVESPDDEIRGQRYPNEIVIPMKKIQVVYDYPLSKEVVFEYEAVGDGFTRAELARRVCEGYQRIYREEEQAVGDPGHIPGMLNRQRSDGPYGIWGHDIGDLVLHSVEQIRDNLFTLGVDS